MTNMIINKPCKWFEVILIGVTLGFAATTVSMAQPESRGRDNEHAGPRHRPGTHVLTPQQIHEALDVVDRIDPQMAQHLRDRYAEDPKAVGRALRERMPRIFRFMQLRRNDPALFEMRVDEISLASRTSELSIEYQLASVNANQQQLQTFEQRLTELITERFELQQAIREHEINKLQHRIDDLHEQLEEYENAKDKMIARRLAQITGRDGSNMHPSPQQHNATMSQPKETNHHNHQGHQDRD